RPRPPRAPRPPPPPPPARLPPRTWATNPPGTPGARRGAAGVTPGGGGARRNLAMIWLEKRRPLRALPLIEQALERDRESIELQYLRGVALLDARRYAEAADALLAVARREPGFRQGEPSLRAADARGALGRWPDAEQHLADYVDTVNQSSVEGWYRLWSARRAQGNAAGAREALRHAQDAYRGSPAFHRRRQVGWYLRARMRAIA